MIALNGQGKTRGTVSMLRIKATCNQSLVSINTKNEKVIINDFIYLFLRFNYQQIRDISGDKKRSGLNMKLIGNIEIKVPPINEQIRMLEKVNILKKYSREINKKIAKTEQLTSSLLQKAFKGEL